MHGNTTDSDYYVAPTDAPPSRRPPITTVGLLGWMRKNLFSSPLNTVTTFASAAVIGWFAWKLLSWSIFSAQWGVVSNSLRPIMTYQYPRKDIWRVEFVTGMFTVLTGLGLGIWGHVARRAFVAFAIILAMILIIPLIGARIPEPRIYMLVEPQRTPYDFVFLGAKGQKIAFEVDPLTDLADAQGLPGGYLEMQSRTEWSTQARAARGTFSAPSRSPPLKARAS